MSGYVQPCGPKAMSYINLRSAAKILNQPKYHRLALTEVETALRHSDLTSRDTAVLAACRKILYAYKHTSQPIPPSVREGVATILCEVADDIAIHEDNYGYGMPRAS